MLDKARDVANANVARDPVTGTKYRHIYWESPTGSTPYFVKKFKKAGGKK